jgi:hypothetical protein
MGASGSVNIASRRSLFRQQSILCSSAAGRWLSTPVGRVNTANAFADVSSPTNNCAHVGVGLGGRGPKWPGVGESSCRRRVWRPGPPRHLLGRFVSYSHTLSNRDATTLSHLGDPLELRARCSCSCSRAVASWGGPFSGRAATTTRERRGCHSPMSSNTVLTWREMLMGVAVSRDRRIWRAGNGRGKDFFSLLPCSRPS